MQQDLDKLQLWSNTWKVKFKQRKYKEKQTRLRLTASRKISFRKSTCKKDFGVDIVLNLSPEKHIRVFRGANYILVITIIAYNYMNKDHFKILQYSLNPN